MSLVEIKDVRQGYSDSSFIFFAMLTLVFDLLVNFAMGFKIKKINMVENLKSVE